VPVKLANWLQEQTVGFALRLRKNENVQQDSVFVELIQLGLKPGTYRKRFDIEEMFQDLKSGGYNLEETQVTGDRLIGLLVLMTLAYSMTTIEGKTLKTFVAYVVTPSGVVPSHS